MTDTRATTTTRLVLPLLLAAVVTLGGCGGGKTASTTTSTAGRPESPVKVTIVQPTAGAVTAPNVTVVVQLDSGAVVARTTGPLTPTEGHIHLSVDGKLVSMAYKTTEDLNGLAPGPHTLLAEFVAVDHAPFRNRPQASVIFTVAG